MNLELEGVDGVNVRRNVSLAPFTSIRTGGRARCVVEVEKSASLSEVIRRVRHSGISAQETFILGGGTNLLVSDEGYAGLVVRLLGEFTRLEVLRSKIISGAAASLMKLIMTAKEKGLGGFEFMTGIPGTIGGAIAMNAGAWGKGIWDIVETVHGVDHSGHDSTIGQASHDTDYRTGNLPEGFIVAEAVLRFNRVDPREVEKNIENVLGKRRRLSAEELKTFGSVFKNPPGQSAGVLLERAGLKGLKCGGAKISDYHANFIVNEGNATSGDILELIKSMRRAVEEKFEVKLVPEVVLLGFEENAFKR